MRLHCYGYTLYIYLSHIIKQHVLFKLHASIFNRSSQNACCNHSSVDTHTGSVENIITVCLHALGGGGNVQQLLYTSETILSDKVDICTGSSSIAMLQLFFFLLSH